MGTAAAAVAQTTAPGGAPGAGTESSSSAGQSVPVGNLPKAAPTFPAVDPAAFTAQSPSVETVNSFLHALWGFDENRTWSVSSIEPTMAPGVVQVHVYVAEKTQPGHIGQTVLFITPDGKHVISNEVLSFGVQPFAEARAVLQQRANGPTRGGAGKDLEMVEFADLECVACRTAQATIDQLLQDFPEAHFVFEDMPLRAHPAAFQAAAVGHCVRQSKGDAAFFAYARKVYDTQSDLAKDREATLRAAVTAAGADPAAVMSCAAAPATQDAVKATVKLGADIGVSNEPMLMINGRAVPVAQVSSEVLDRVVVFQGTLDGIAVHAQPRLSTLK